MRSHAPTLLLLALPIALGAAACGDSGLSEAALRGRAVFFEHSSPTCAACHGLPYEGTKSAVNIPELSRRPLDLAKVQKAVTQGIGIMPAQKGVLTQEQIADVAKYVTEAARRPMPEGHVPYAKSAD